MDRPIADLRKEYALQGLSEAEADRDPLRQFDTWFDQAVRANVTEPNAMALATVDAAGRPAVRIVLLKGYDARGFVFYTDYRSRKGRELAANPRAALCLWWADLERQVRIEGEVARIDPADSDAYFASRPRASQLGACVSTQSIVIPGRHELEAGLQSVDARYAGQPVPRPREWGGYRLTPDRIEFWQGRPQRLHDRLAYERQADGGWEIVRLSP